MNMNLTMKTVAGNAPLRRSRWKPKTFPNFPYGDVIRPDDDLVGRSYYEQRRHQICVTKEEVQRLLHLSSRLAYKPWKMGHLVHLRPGPPSNGVTRVVTTRYGYRAEHGRPGGLIHNLGNALAEVPLLFPTAEAAIAASEVALHELEEGWMYKWLHPSCGFNATN
jgi:hypothetical protein